MSPDEGMSGFLKKRKKIQIFVTNSFVVVVVECCFTFKENVGLLGTGAQDGHRDSHSY